MQYSRYLTMTVLICLTFVTSQAHGAEASKNADPLENYNVIWESPSKDHNGSMPIGNGDIGMNVWVEPNGDLVFYISKTDAWSENCRLLKLGRVRVKLSPNPIVVGGPFKQTLRLRQGEILIEAGAGEKAVTIRVWCDANRPVIYVEADGSSPLEMRATLEVWRKKERKLGSKEIISAYGLHGGPLPAVVHPDKVLGNQKDRIVWYHRNEKSIWENNLKHQGMATWIDKANDPLLHRTFGGCIRGEGLVAEDATTLKSARPQKRVVLSIYPVSTQAATADAWLKQVDESIAQNSPGGDLEKHRAKHRAWWNGFWNRSWIRATGSANAEAVSRGYTLQRWISACAGRGVHPIKFNGTIFNVDGAGFDADYRAWGGPYWWQNTRLPYWPMLASGDFDMMKPMFRMYEKMLPLAEHRTKVWFGHEGAFIGETVYFWGMYNNANYGWKRPANLPVGELTNRYIRREYTASPELMAMMLDYYSYTRDKTFLQKTLLPMCDSLLTFWDKHYKNEKGLMKMYPAQALETLQNVQNPTPDVAGLKWVLGKLLDIPEKQVDAKRREFWTRLSKKVPPLPTMVEKNGQKRILGAAKVFGRRGNSENPELYAVFPFRLYGVGKPDLDIGRLTFARRAAKGNYGWRQDDTQAALLGLTDTVAGYVAGRAKRKHGASRFPAFWGPNMDWNPDQTHGGNLLMALQAMLMQADRGKILLLPAWPKKWDVKFKLCAPGGTVVEGIVRDGKVVTLKVFPEARKKDVEVMASN